jgi:hypothetical protein
MRIPRKIKGVQMKAAQKAAQLMQKLSRKPLSCKQSSMLGPPCPTRLRLAFWQWSARPAAHTKPPKRSRNSQKVLPNPIHCRRADLRMLLGKWADLPKPIQAGIVAMVKAAANV